MLYLVRHGQTEWNVQGRGQGQLDSPLTATGVAQACAHARALAGVPLTRAYTSPLGRATRTAGIIRQGRQVPLTPLDDLIEVHLGEVAGLLPEERLARFPSLQARRRADKYRTVLPGGESYETASPRAARAVQGILAEGGGHVLVVAHEMIGRLLRMHLLGLTPEQAMQTGHPQDVIYRVQGGKIAVLGQDPEASNPA